MKCTAAVPFGPAAAAALQTNSVEVAVRRRAGADSGAVAETCVRLLIHSADVAPLSLFRPNCHQGRKRQLFPRKRRRRRRFTATRVTER